MVSERARGNSRLPLIRGNSPSAENINITTNSCRQLSAAFFLKSSEFANLRAQTTRRNGYESSSMSLEGKVARNNMSPSTMYGGLVRVRYSNAIAYDNARSVLPNIIRGSVAG